MKLRRKLNSKNATLEDSGYLGFWDSGSAETRKRAKTGNETGNVPGSETCQALLEGTG